jgi:hypothetical protein
MVIKSIQFFQPFQPFKKRLIQNAAFGGVQDKLCLIESAFGGVQSPVLRGRAFGRIIFLNVSGVQSPVLRGLSLFNRIRLSTFSKKS